MCCWFLAAMRPRIFHIVCCGSSWWVTDELFKRNDKPDVQFMETGDHRHGLYDREIDEARFSVGLDTSTTAIAAKIAVPRTIPKSFRSSSTVDRFEISAH